jgi:hypothetical protein
MKLPEPTNEMQFCHLNRAVGASVSDDEYSQGMEELKVFRDWFNDNIMMPTDTALSDAIMIMPCGSANPKYRDTPNE